MVIYFDTETTGLYPGQICQLSYVLQEKESVVAKNFFFSVSYMPQEVVKVHGFTKERLLDLSKGKTFSDHVDEIRKDFENADVIVSHNINFDCMFMRAEFERLGGIFKYKELFCSMKKFTPVCKLKRSDGVRYKYPRLNELTEFLDIYEYDITKKTKEIFGVYVGGHDARFDTTALYLIMNDKNNELSKEFAKRYLK